MSSFHITWRSSGGRGEFEFSPVDTLYENKPIVVSVFVGGMDHTISTDTILARNGGKRRLRRQNPNDRQHLSIPNLVSAVLALPKPTRDRDNVTAPSLAEGRWAIGSLELEIESEPTEAILRVRPLRLKPRHFFAPIEIAGRLDTLAFESAGNNELAADVKKHIALVEAGTNTTLLEDSALAVFNAFTLKNHDVPILATPEEARQAAIITETEVDLFPQHKATEGKKKLVAHVLRERNKGLVKKRKDAFQQANGRLFCECCGLTPSGMYGAELDGLIEAHHSIPLNECGDDEVRVTSFDDLVLLCRNCHGATHRLDPMPGLAELRAMLLMVPQPIIK